MREGGLRLGISFKKKDATDKFGSGQWSVNEEGPEGHQEKVRPKQEKGTALECKAHIIFFPTSVPLVTQNIKKQVLGKGSLDEWTMHVMNEQLQEVPHCCDSKE